MEPGDLQPPFDSLALLLPIAPLLAIAIAYALRGAARRMAFALGPFLAGCAMWWVRPAIVARPGDWLASLGTSALFGCSYLAIGVYYVVLLVTATGLWLRRNAALRRAATTLERRPA